MSERVTKPVAERGGLAASSNGHQVHSGQADSSEALFSAHSDQNTSSDSTRLVSSQPFDPDVLQAFRMRVLERGDALYRDLPWRRTRDPYAIWVSEVMLQQTQVARVDGRWQRWLRRFPTVEALATAEAAEVLEEWQGMGYNRRALALLHAAQAIANSGGLMPCDEKELVVLPGIGPATAAGIRVFAYDLSAVYLETNVRSVFLHEFFPDALSVSDRQLVPLIQASCPAGEGEREFNPEDDPRRWYYALLDYGAYLKRTVGNPSRRSSTHTKQSRFEGSHRQKRAALVRLLLARRSAGTPCDSSTLTAELGDIEQAAGRPQPEHTDVESLLKELAREGFCHQEEDGAWAV